MWKWLDSGEVEFRVRAVSATGADPQPVIRIGYRLVRGHERRVFLDGVRRRMRTFVQVGLEEDAAAEPIRRAADALTARSSTPSAPRTTSWPATSRLRRGRRACGS